MKASVIRSALEGHGWIGLFISIPLFIVFWAGSLTLFYPEIKAWSVLPHTEYRSVSDQLPLNNILDTVFSEYDVNTQQRMFVVLPTETMPLYELHLPVNETPSAKNALTSIYVDPVNGETVASIDSFHLADFLYGLHIDLNLPLGDHIVGIVTLFFTVVIFTGLVVQFKKLITHFFYYRGGSTTLRYQLTDMHNVVGVMSLPYTFMYALTGLMFNLGLISQIVTLLFIYDGDRTALLNDTGFPRVTESYTGIEREMPDLNTLITSWEEKENAKASSLRLTNYGDENALIRIIGQHRSNFSQRIDMTYRVRENEFSADLNPAERNAFADGTRFLYALHFGHFAGVDIRIVFFILGLGTDLNNRSFIVETAFFAVYAISIIGAFFTKHVHLAISRTALASGLILALLSLIEALGHNQAIIQFLNNGYTGPFAISFVSFAFACLLFWLGIKLSEKDEKSKE
jgi:hypothetical protein